MKRIIFILLSLLLCLSVAQAEEVLYESDFAGNTDGWYGRGCSVLVTRDGLYTAGRTATWNSPGRPFSLKAGAIYQISVEVKQSKLDSGRFILSVEHAKDGTTTYENLGFATVNKDAWTTLSATWTAGDYDTYILYIEGGEKDTPFFIRKSVMRLRTNSRFIYQPPHYSYFITV